MKKLLLVAGLFFSALGVNAQDEGDIGLNLYGGHTFGDNISANMTTRLRFYENFQWGVGTEFYLRPTKSIELKYLRMDTRTSLFPQTETQNYRDISTNINYILVGGNNYFHTANAKVIPFLGLDLGVGWVNASNRSHTGFAWDFKGGVKIKASDVVSIKLQAYFQTIWASYGGKIVVFPGWGAVAFAQNSSLYQFGLGGAFAFDFKN